MIRKSAGGGYELRSRKTGRRLSKPGISKKAAAKRERQVQYFKHAGQKLYGGRR